MHRIITIITSLLFLTLAAQAQTGWQWGKRGGGSSGSDDHVLEMVTDRNGNLYVLAELSKNSGTNIDGYACPFANEQLSLTKWDCNGNRKWTKFFGGVGTLSAASMASPLAIDSMGGLYFTGRMSMAASTPSGPQTVYFDTDVPSFYTAKCWYIIKYDTSGTFKWLKMPQADTVTNSNATYGTWALGLDVATNGDAYILAHLAPGIYSGSEVSTAMNTFRVMQYDKDGNFMGAVPIPITVSINSFGQPNLSNFANYGTGFTRDHNSGKFYISGSYYSGYGSLAFGNTPIITTDTVTAAPRYLTAFDSSGNLLWVKQSSPDGGVGRALGRLGIDEFGNIYLCGGASPGSVFFGHTFANTYTGAYAGYSSYYVLSVDSAGGLRWARNSGNGMGTLSMGSCYANGIVSVSTAWEYFLCWGADTVTTPLLGFADHVASFNAYTGVPIKKIDTFGLSGPGSSTAALAPDGKGNIYVGGQFASQVILPSVTLTNLGGTFDFFVAKYGTADCNCSPASPNFTYAAASGGAVIFTYTGSTPIDSVRWEFGDGGMASGLTASHTYAAAGTYGVSIVVYNSCGIIVYYKEVATGGGGTGIDGIDPASSVSIYPNPANESILIEGAGRGTVVALYNAIGQQVLSTTIAQDKQPVDVSGIGSGTYIIRFTTKEGRQGSVKMVKR
ncbi:MAG: T9SS type A sorting domain-containing protein [Edaphocola sp.]